MYATTLARFLSRDPILEPGNQHLVYDTGWFGERLSAMRDEYGYVSGNPVNGIDPSGLVGSGIIVPGQPNPWTPPYYGNAPEGGIQFCISYARGASSETSGIVQPHSEGQYRHCIAACCLRRRWWLIGDIGIGLWDVVFEDQNDPLSHGDMAAERSGICVSKTKQSCKDGCKDAMKPGSPCFPKPEQPWPRPCDRGEGPFPGWAGA